MDSELDFSDFLFDVVYSQNISLTELLVLFSRKIESLDKKEASVEGIPKAITPGSPIIEFVATQRSNGWNELNDLFKKDGIEENFFGIIINGRVNINLVLRIIINHKGLN